MTKRSILYRDSGRVPLASVISVAVRRKIFDRFLRYCAPGPDTEVLDVGVTCDAAFQESNFFEHLYPYPHKITCVGTEDGSHLEREFPGLAFRMVEPGEPLPFSDGRFDVAFSNAVVEHTGSRERQGQFVAELCRVGRTVFIATPNRWFPVEHHTGLPFLHYLPSRAYRAILKRTRFRYWADEDHLNILTAKSLLELFPPDVSVEVGLVHILGIPSNVIAFARSSG